MKVRLSGITALLVAASAVLQVLAAMRGDVPHAQAYYACLAAWFAGEVWIRQVGT